MGQYHKIVNLTKREYIHPHNLGAGLNFVEQIWNTPGTAAALLALMVCPVSRGGGDYSGGAIGRWHGDHIVMVGDYADDNDMDIPGDVVTSDLYDLCADSVFENLSERGYTDKHLYVDVSMLIAPALEDIFDGKFSGDGWREFKAN